MYCVIFFYYAVGLQIIRLCQLAGLEWLQKRKKWEKDICSENELKLHTNKQRLMWTHKHTYTHISDRSDFPDTLTVIRTGSWINQSRSCSVSSAAVTQIFKASLVGVFRKRAGSLKRVHSAAPFSTPRPFSFLCRQIKEENQQGEHDIKIRVESAERLSALGWKMAGRNDVKGARWWTHTQDVSLLIMH